jgi:hypothetical protein
MSLGTLAAGCYTWEPARGPEPLLGTPVAFDINDVGRAALGGSMGPEIGTIEGRLVQQDSAGFQVAVTGVQFLRGGEQRWTGEQVRVKREFVSSVYERHFSATRSVALGAGAIGMVVALAGKSLIGSGQGEPGKTPPDTSHTARLPRP